MIERILGAELSHHLGYPPGADKPGEVSNHRNGATGKTVLTEDGPLRIDVPRDRQGSFEPLLIPKHERRFTGFDDKIVAMYARGMTIREIQGFLAEQYGTEVSPELIISVTDAVMAEVAAWQSRQLEAMYPVVFFDALRVKIREDAVVRNKAIYLALGVLPDGTRDILGLWIENTEGAKFWMKVFNDLKTRGVADILIAVTDGLKGMPEVRLGNIFAPPVEVTFQPWVKAWSEACTGLNCDGLSRGFWNSVRITIPSVIISILIASVNGYALANWRFKGANIFFTILIVGAFIPYQVMIYPIVIILREMGVYGTLTGLGSAVELGTLAADVARLYAAEGDAVRLSIDALAALFHEKALCHKVDPGEPRYRNALFHLLASQTSCYRYWGQGTWTDYGREICRRTKDILTYDFP